MQYYVSAKAAGPGDGSRERPFPTIQQAAELAQPGDEILIGEGIYREWVNPVRGGTAEQPIVYRNLPGERPVISGAEIVQGWRPWRDGVWTASVPNTLFGSFNPYKEILDGDWFDSFGRVHHLGEVFWNGQALNEVEDILAADITWGWACQVDDTETRLYLRCGDEDPNQALTEISVRPHCFWPRQTGINYITVSGLTMRQVATQWAPPTAFQPGAIGPHWSRGWVIENNIIHDSKCCGISLGKRASIDDNAWSRNPHQKDGGQTYTETIFTELNNNWNKQHIGSHVVRHNLIYNCGQAGIVGNMGCVFSIVSGNLIHNINTRGEFGGAEIAAIKFHCAIDVQVTDNILCHNTRGLWLDWQAQGARVSRNVMYDHADMDLFIEVCHGPCLVDNNLLLSGRSLLNLSEGTAFVHNLFAGRVDVSPDGRFTPYHFPHQTAVLGVINIQGGDDRLFNNLFIGAPGQNGSYGTHDYAKYRAFSADGQVVLPEGGLPRSLPVRFDGNVYLNGACCCPQDTTGRQMAFEPVLTVRETAEGIFLETNLADCPLPPIGQPVDTQRLGTTFQAGARYETPDGQPVTIDYDFTGAQRKDYIPGPFEGYAPSLRLSSRSPMQSR